MSLQKLSQINSVQTQKTEDNFSISLYNGELTTKVIVEEVSKIKKAFPQLPAGFYEILADRLKENGFTDTRLKDAINHLIDNFTYPVPTIANIISFDKRIKLISYFEIANMASEFGISVWNQYKAVRKVGKVRYFASLKDIEDYNLEVLK